MLTYFNISLSVEFMLQSFNRIHFLFILLFGYCLVFPLNAEYKEGEIIVRYNDNATAVEKHQTAASYVLLLKKSYRLTSSFLYGRDSKKSIIDLKKELEKLESVKYVSLNFE